MEKDRKDGKYTGKIGNLMRLGDKKNSNTKILNQTGKENKNERTTNKVEYGEEEDGVTRKTQPNKCKI